MVAPVKIEWDEKKVADGGKVIIRGYDPYAPNEIWTAKAADGNEYTGAEVTSEGFHIFGLNPYAYYSAGYACYMSNPGWMQDTWDCWDNNMDLAGITAGGIVGFKYFGFGGLDKDSKGIKAFSAAKKGNKTAINLFITPRTDKAFKINVMLDGPYANSTWNGKKIATISVSAGAAKQSTQLTADVAAAVEGLKGKHAIYLVAEADAEGREPLFDMHGIGFSSSKVKLERPVPPVLEITMDGKKIDLPTTPIRSTNQNGICDVNHYAITYEGTLKDLRATCPSKDVKIEIDINDNKASVTGIYKGLKKIYTMNFSN